MIPFAEFSRLAYSSNPSVPGWSLTRVDKRGTLVCTNQDKVVIAFRGTVPSSPADISADLMLAGGRESLHPMFRSALKLVQASINEYKKDRTIHLTGHSLGGSLAMYCFHRYWKDIESCVVFNPGLGRSDVFKSIFDSLWCGLIKTARCRKFKHSLQIHRVKWDPVSIAAGVVPRPGSVNNHSAHRSNVHSIRNFF